MGVLWKAILCIFHEVKNPTRFIQLTSRLFSPFILSSLITSLKTQRCICFDKDGIKVFLEAIHIAEQHSERKDIEIPSGLFTVACSLLSIVWTFHFTEKMSISLASSITLQNGIILFVRNSLLLSQVHNGFSILTFFLKDKYEDEF